MTALKTLFLTPIASRQHWGIILLITVAFVLSPKVRIHDWLRNIQPLPSGLAIYENPSYVYPPWALILFWADYIIGATGTQVATVLTVVWWAWVARWTLLQLILVVISPLFLWLLINVNVDLLVMLLPVLIWETIPPKSGRWDVFRGLCIALMLLKPQGSLFVVLYWLWTLRHERARLALILAVVALILVPVSLIGSPPLALQWLDNIRHPSEDNASFWDSNNISLTYDLGIVPAILIVSAGLAAVYAFRRYMKWGWTKHHLYALLFFLAMMVSPYASNQGAIVPLIFVNLAVITVFQAVGVLYFSVLVLYGEADAWVIFSLTMLSLAFYRRRAITSESSG